MRGRALIKLIPIKGETNLNTILLVNEKIILTKMRKLSIKISFKTFECKRNSNISKTLVNSEQLINKFYSFTILTSFFQ